MENVDKLINDLLCLLDRKKVLFEDIMEITLEQKKDIEENDANGIETLINRKQSAIDSIDEIDRAFSEGFSQMKKQLNINSMDELDYAKYPLLKSLKHKVSDIIVQAKEVMEIEEQNKLKLTEKLEEVKKDMKQLSIGKKTIQAYQNPNTYNDGIYIDKKK